MIRYTHPHSHALSTAGGPPARTPRPNPPADTIARPHGLSRCGAARQGRVPGRTGVWVGDRKLGAVGVRISHGVATHGVALNVATDLRAFAPIVACGLADAVATSLQHELTAAARPGGGGPEAFTGEGAGGGPAATRSPGCDSLAGRASDAQGARGLGSPGAPEAERSGAAPNLQGLPSPAGGGGNASSASGDAGPGRAGAREGECASAGGAGRWMLGGVDAVELVAAQLADAFASRFRYSQRECVTPAELHAVAAGAG